MRSRALVCSELFSAVLIGAVLTITPAVEGCAHRRVEHVEEVRSSDDTGSRASLSHEEVKRETTTETESDGCSGVLSCTVDAVGHVIALPFKAVGALVNAIF